MSSLDAEEAQRIVRDRLAAIDRGEPGVPAAQALADVRKRLGVKRK